MANTELTELKEIFSLFDPDSTGYIEVNDLLQALKSVNYDSKSPDIYKMVEDMLDEDDGKISMETYLEMMNPRVSTSSTDQEINRIYKLFDYDRKDYIDTRDLARVGREVGVDVKEGEVSDIIKYADLDEDGKLSTDDFNGVIKQQITYYSSDRTV